MLGDHIPTHAFLVGQGYTASSVKYGGTFFKKNLFLWQSREGDKLFWGNLWRCALHGGLIMKGKSS